LEADLDIGVKLNIALIVGFCCFLVSLIIGCRYTSKRSREVDFEEQADVMKEDQFLDKGIK
jgi:hypothetical protein